MIFDTLTLVFAPIIIALMIGTIVYAIREDHRQVAEVERLEKN